MKVEQLYTGCLAEAAYYIESNGEVAIIDPLRDPQPYMDMADKAGARIKYVLETHFHADFVSGHLDLAKKTGATIVYGPTAKPNFEAHIATDGEELKLGNVTIKVLHTPGHTMESSSFLLIDENGKPHSLYSGDTLFIGDVGRPDLAVTTDITREDLASYLFDSLRNKIMTLPEDVIIYPNHGAGSACGKNMSKETWDTLGNQLKTNYALRKEMTREEFVKEVTSGLVTPPQYFPKNAVINKTGYGSLDFILEKGMEAIEPADFKKMAANDRTIILDTRPNTVFPQGFVPGSIFIGVDDNFAPWVGALIEDLQTPILFIAEEGKEEEVIVRLSRVGYDNTIGYLKGGIEAWKAAGYDVETLDEVEADDFAKAFNADDMTTLDVRKESEYESEHLMGVRNYPLDTINSNLDKLDKGHKYYLHCAGGYRSVIAASILRKNGFKNLVNIKGGYKKLKETGLKLTEYQEQTTML
ncbi:MAG: MBL fold metallo-hydrolase [Flavobacteriales bacterium]|nr:MBL fold metallo-hydrolase [Flavobacteriales bacterium]